MARLLVVGSPSLDILHFAGQTHPSAGGAGMYTAMAARRCGAQASIFAPRPEPMPEELQPVSAQLQSWHGPVVPPTEMPHFEISHEGDEATYLNFIIRSEADLVPEMLPEDLSGYDCVHIIALGEANRQHTFLQACLQRGAKCLSLGTFIDSVKSAPDVVRSSMQLSDVFFMNEKEAIALFGSIEEARTWPGKVLYITLGANGAIVVQGATQTHLPAVLVDALDPTGAGDAFCGATLANLLQGVHPIMAARLAMPVAAEETEHVGPTSLLWSDLPPDLRMDQRVVINQPQVERISVMIKDLAEAAPFEFVGPDFPSVDHPAVLDYFFAATLQQFGFWTAVDGRYHHPLIAPIAGKELKGSSYLFQAYVRRLAEDPGFCTPQRQADLTREQMLDVFHSDDGDDPMPALDLHLEQAQQYGRDMLALGLTPQEIVRQAQSSNHPLKTFLGLLDHIGGYKEDPLRKKSGLLALILNQRPEGFLTFGANESVAPVIDYHLMRSCLRTGLIDVTDEALKSELDNRRVLSVAEEWAVRLAAYRAVEQVVAVSGKSIGAVDWFFFGARKRCPEMSEPVCGECPVNPVCAHRTELFQPVIRTVFY